MTDPVTLQRQEDGIVVLSLQDEANRNAFNEPFVEALVGALTDLSEREDERVCILRGLPEVFCAGADFELLLRVAEGEVAVSDIALSKALLDLPQVTVAAMEGHAVGGGLALALCCDILLMANESRYGCSFMNMGFTPGMGVTRLLQEAVGEYLANEMMFGGEMMKGSRFAARSGVNYVLPRQEVFPKALQVARRIAEKPAAALRLLKQNLSVRRRRLFEEARTTEGFMHEVCFSQPETRKRIEDNYIRPNPESASPSPPERKP